MDITPKKEEKVGRRVESFIIGQMMDLEEDGFKPEHPSFNPSRSALDAIGKSAWSKYFRPDQMTLVELKSMILCLNFVVQSADNDDFDPRDLDGFIWQLEQLQMLKTKKDALAVGEED